MKSGKPEFYQDYNGKKLCPLQPKHSEFPFEEVDRNLSPIMDEDARRADAVQFVSRILAFVTKTSQTQPLSEDIIGRRFAALAWVINPGMFEGSPSATQLAKRLGIKSPHRFHLLTGEATREFGISNRGQCHAWNRGQTKTNKAQ